ncbi:Unknown protein sequence [Pseudomonas amygdali pv. sesami]|nr:Unknown protein sequence [Pseudomonas amygdali pv. sesami]
MAQPLPLPQKRFSTVKEPDEVEPETGAKGLAHFGPSK